MTKEYCEEQVIKLANERDDIVIKLDEMGEKIKQANAKETDENYRADYGRFIKYIREKRYKDLSFYFNLFICFLRMNEEDEDLKHNLPIFRPTKEELDMVEKVISIEHGIDAFESYLQDSDWKQFDGDIIITDPCYIISGMDRGEEYDDMYDKLYETLEEKFLVSTTIYGDWGCHTVDENENVLGRFCADSGMVCVMPLKDALEINPNFDYHIERPWTTTLIKDFHGQVRIEIEEDHNDYDVHVVGKGNINFKTYQTSL